MLLTGCIGSPTDEIQIMQIAKNIEKAIEEKDVDLFMENISYNYSDPDGGIYDNHINNLPEEIFSKIEDAEDLADISSVFKIKPKVSIPESDIIVTDIYASGKMEMMISLEACLLIFCADLYNETTNYKIISMEEI